MENNYRVYLCKQHSSVWLSGIHLTDASELHNIVKLDMCILNTAEAQLALQAAVTGDFTACPLALAITTQLKVGSESLFKAGSESLFQSVPKTINDKLAWLFSLISLPSTYSLR